MAAPGVGHAMEPPPTSSHRIPPWAVLAIVCIGQFMVVLDVSIVNVALPSMQRDLHFSTSGLQWVVNAYALAFGGFLLLGGRAGDLFGRKRMFLGGLALFTGASAVCAISQDQAMLIGARALQGIGGAVLSPATLTILTTSFTEPRRRSHALGMWSAMAAAGGASGALLGGLLTDLLGWRWIFFINLPVGAVALVAATVVLGESRAEHRPKLDVAGAVVVTGGLVGIVDALAGTTTHTWGSPATLVPLAAGAALLGVFAVLETRPGRAPLVPFTLFRSRGVTASNLSMLLVGAAMFPMWLFLSLYLQEVDHFSPLLTGLGFLPQTLAIVVGAQVSSRLVHRIGPRPPLVLGLALAGIGLAWLWHVHAHASYWATVFGGGSIATLGMGLAFTPLAFAATAGVSPNQAGLASGVLNTSRQVGGSVGLAALATVAADRTAALRTRHVEQAVALTSGFGRAFGFAALLALAGAACGIFVPARRATPDSHGAEAGPMRDEAPDAGLAVVGDLGH